MKNNVLDRANHTEPNIGSLSNPLLAFARRLATRVSEHQKRQMLERNLYLMKRVFDEIPTHVLEDIGLTEYQAEEIVNRISRENTVLVHPFFPIRK